MIQSQHNKCTPMRAMIEVFGTSADFDDWNCSLRVYMKINVQKWLVRVCQQALTGRACEAAFKVGVYDILENRRDADQL